MSNARPARFPIWAKSPAPGSAEGGNLDTHLSPYQVLKVCVLVWHAACMKSGQSPGRGSETGTWAGEGSTGTKAREIQGSQGKRQSHGNEGLRRNPGNQAEERNPGKERTKEIRVGKRAEKKETSDWQCRGQREKNWGGSVF